VTFFDCCLIGRYQSPFFLVLDSTHCFHTVVDYNQFISIRDNFTAGVAQLCQ
jgi:hypothetical protein